MTKPTISFENTLDGQKLSRAQMAIFACAIFTLCIDGFDIQILSYLMPSISREWSIETAMQGAILSAGLTGMTVGYLLVPLAAAHLGLRRVVIGCLLLMGASTFLLTIVTTERDFIILRILTGISLGGVFPNVVALATEYFPPRRRSTLVTIMFIGVPLGYLISGWVAYVALPHVGWRGVMFIGGLLPLISAALVFVIMPESMEYLIRKGDEGQDRARRVMRRVAPDTQGLDDALIEAGASRQTGATVFDLFRANRGIGTIILWSCLALNSIVYFFVLTWMPLVLVRMGIDESTAILASSLINVSGIIAAFATGPLMDRFDPPRVLAAHFVAAAVFAVLVGLILSQNVMIIVPMAMCLGFCVSGLHKGISALAMQFYPIELRSIGLGWTFGVGRLGAVAGPVVAGIQLAAGWTPSQIFYAMLIPLSVGALSALGMNHFYGRKPQKV